MDLTIGTDPAAVSARVVENDRASGLLHVAFDQPYQKAVFRAAA